MAVSELPNPSTTIIYFLVVTILYIFGNIFLNINKSENYLELAAQKRDKYISLIYLVIIIIGSYAINLSISRAMCSQSIQWGNVAMITLFPWIIIFGSLYFILTYFPGWTSPFSNTIGYLIIGGLGIDQTYDEIFKTGEEAKENNELVKAIANMNSNRTKFVNQISYDLEEFIKFFNNMKDAVKDNVPLPNMDSPVTPIRDNAPPSKKTSTNANEPQTGGVDNDIDPIMKLYRLIVIKQFIGKVVWYILAGILISSISYNLIITMSCNRSLDEINKDFESSKIKSIGQPNESPPVLNTTGGVNLNTTSLETLTSEITDNFS
jgi:hypothetical protein